MLTAVMMCLPLWVQNDAKPVQLPSRIRSLAQLAGELSAQGISTRCDASISNRLALVCVRGRTWNNLRPLLERGLEVHFTQRAEGTWTLTADPTAVSREKTLRDHFVKRYQKGIEDILTPAWNAADELRRLDKPEHDRKLQDIQAILTRPGESSIPSMQKQIAYLTRDLELEEERASLWPLRQPLDLAALLPAPVVHTEQIANLAQDNSEVGQRIRAWLKSRFNKYPLPVSMLYWYGCLRFHPLTFSLTETINGAIEPNGKIVGNPDLVPGKIEQLPFTLRDVFVEAGQGEALAASEQATNGWLGSQGNADRAVSLEVSERTLSATVQKWSAQNGREVIMEVSPHRDVLPGYNAISPNVTLNIARALQSGHAPQEGELSNGVGIGEQNRAAQRYLDATPNVEKTPIDINMRVWTASQLDDVALIHNQLAFLDNVATRNPAAALLLTERRAQHEDHLLTFDDLLSAARVLSSRDNTLSADSSLYVGTGDYARAYPLLRLLDTYPQRDVLQKELAKNGVAYLETRHCTLSALNTLTETLRSLALLGPGNSLTTKCFEHDFPLWLRQGVLEIKTEPSEFGKGVWLTLTVYKSAERQADQTYTLPERLWQATVGPLSRPQVPTRGKESANP